MTTGESESLSLKRRNSIATAELTNLYKRIDKDMGTVIKRAQLQHKIMGKYSSQSK
jgi:hypothetical protein